ncbi:MAG: hypothetical protein AAB448_03325 [Patescibacteria group bacterium]
MTSSRATIPLILFTLALSFAAVALIINGALSTPTIEEISASCGEQFFASQEPVACPIAEAPQAETIAVGPALTHPGFSYPAGWNAVATTDTADLGTKTTITLAVGGLFTSCETCTEGVIATITTEPSTLAGTETLDAYVQSRYANTPDAIIQKSTLNNGIKYIISGISSGETIGPFTDVFFFGATTQVTTLFAESDTLPAGILERSALLGSLDFSLIP